MNLSSQTWYAVFMNIAGCIFAITGIVLYAIDLAEASVVWMCDLNWSTAQFNDNCKYVAFFAQVNMLLKHTE